MTNIELTHEQAETTVELLNQLEARLDAIGNAQEIIAVLAEC